MNNKEKEFVKPTLEIVIFQIEDIVCTSPADTIDDEELVP